MALSLSCHYLPFKNAELFTAVMLPEETGKVLRRLSGARLRGCLSALPRSWQKYR